MHEVSLGNTIRDYLSGEEIDETTYEEFRQALARLLVEEKGFPKDRLTAKEEFCVVIEGKDVCRPIDLVVRDPDGRPLLLVLFCAGEIGTYEREASCAARLFPGGPAPFTLVTDTLDASLLNAATGDVLARGMAAIPHWEELVRMGEKADRSPLDPERRAKLERIFNAYTGFVLGACCRDDSCSS